MCNGRFFGRKGRSYYLNYCYSRNRPGRLIRSWRGWPRIAQINYDIAKGNEPSLHNRADFFSASTSFRRIDAISSKRFRHAARCHGHRI